MVARLSANGFGWNNKTKIFYKKIFTLYFSIACRGLFFFFITRRNKSQGLQKKTLKNIRRT